MRFRRGLCNLDTSWGSPSPGSLGNLDLNLNSTGYDITRPPRGFSLARTSSSTYCFVLAQVNAEAKPSPSTRVQTQTAHTDPFIDSVMVWGQMMQLRLTSDTDPSTSTQFHFLRFSGFPVFLLAHIYVPPRLTRGRKTSASLALIIVVCQQRLSVLILRGILIKMFSPSHYSYED